MLSHQSLALDSGRRSFPSRTTSNSLPTGRSHPQAGQKTDAHRSSSIHKPHIAPINSIPTEHVPVNVPPYRIDAVEMTKVRDEQADQQGPPDPQI